MENSRRIAYQILGDYTPQKTNLSLLINEILSEYKTTEKGFIRGLVWGVVRHLNTLDFIINSLLKKSSAIPPQVRNALRLGIYQLLYSSDQVPAYAAVNESVAIIAGSKNKSKKGMVNAILREVERKKDSLIWPDEKKDPVKYISIKYSNPEWLTARWLKRFGRDKTIKLCELNNAVPNLCIRVNLLKISRSDLKAELEKENVLSCETQYSPCGLMFSSNPEIEKLESYRKGLFVVQDEASQLVSLMLDPQEGETILDLCSGSGAKTTHLAQIAKNNAQLISVDNSKKQLYRLNDNIRLLGIKNVKILNTDAMSLRDIKADRILFDSPCSGLGVIRRKPDIKWNRQEEDIVSRYPKLQKEILFHCAGLLKNGGVIVYSTCSIEPEENEEVIKEFLDKHADFTLEKTWMPNLILPFEYDMDGFFMARLRKNQ